MLIASWGRMTCHPIIDEGNINIQETEQQSIKNGALGATTFK